MRTGISLNEYEEVVLTEVLEHTLETTLNDFCTKCMIVDHDITPFEAKQLDKLLYTLPPDLKEHVYYKALFLLTELDRLLVKDLKMNEAKLGDW